MNELNLERLCESNQGDLEKVYKEVFKGAPWYEDRICSGARSAPEDPERCTLQYTSTDIPRQIKGIMGSINFAETKNCQACQRPLIEFYPEYVDQNKLIREAQRMQGFYGVLTKSEDQLAGFCWGYAFQKEPTSSVDFPRIAPLLASQGIDEKSAFYWAEIGVVEEYRRRSIGGILAQVLLSNAVRDRYRWLTLRTKNEAIEKILSYAFPRENIQSVFNDPVRGTPWYALDLKKMRELHVSPIS